MIVEKIVAELQVKADQWSSAFGKAAGDVDKFSQRAAQSMAGVGKQMSSAGKDMTAKVTAPVVAVGAISLKTAADFEQSMNMVKVATGAPQAEMKSLNDLAMKMGADTVFSAGEASDAMLELAKGGISTTDIKAGALSATMSLASAGNMELADAATVTMAALNTFGLKGEQAQSVADALAGAANASAADVSDLAIALRQTGSSAASAGQTVQTTTAVLAAMADQGIRGSDAGTSLKTMLMRIAAPTKKASDMMKDLGLKFYDAHGNMKPLDVIAGQLQKKMGGLTQQQRDQAMATMFGSDAVRAANTLFTNGSAGIKKYEDATSKAGNAQEMSNARMQGTAGAIEQMKGSLETAGIAIGNAIAPTVTMLAGKIQELANWFMSLDESTQQTIVKFVAIAAAIGPALILFGSMASGLARIISVGGSVTGTLGKVAKGFSDISKVANPTMANKFGSAMKTAFSGAASAASTSMSTIASAVANPKAALSGLSTLMSTSFSSIASGVASAFSSAVSMGTSMIKGLGTGLQVLGAAIKSHPLLALAGLLLVLLMPVLDDLVAVLRDALMPVFDQLKPIIDLFGQALSEVGTALAPVFQALTQVFKELLAAGQPLIAAFAIFLGAAIQPLIAILPELTPMISFLASVIGGAMVVSIGVMLNAWGMMIAALSGSTSIILGSVISPIVGAFLSFATTVVQAAATAFGWVPGVGEKLQGAAAAMEGFQGSATAAIDQIAQTAGTKGTAIGTQMMKAGQTAVTSGMDLIGNAGETAGKAAAGGLAKGASSAGSEAKGAFEKAGQDAGTGMGDGLSAASGQVTGQASQMASGAVTAIQGQVGPAQSAGNQVGQGIGQGISSGIDSMRGEVMQKAESLARDAANAAKKGAETHSPSRITTWVGEMTARGLVVGLENETKRTLDAARALGRNFGTVMSGAIAPAVNAGGIADAAMAAYDAEKKLQETSNKTNKKGKATGAAKAAKKTLAKMQRDKEWVSVASRVNEIMGRAAGEALSAAGSAIKDSAVYKKAQDALSYIQQLKDSIMDFGGISKLDLSPFSEALKASQEAAKSAQEWTTKLAAAQGKLNAARNAKDVGAIARATREVAAAQQQLTASQAAAAAGSGLTGSALIDDMRSRLQQAKDFSTITEKLRTMGLNKSSLDEIMKAGVQNGSMIGQALIEQGSGAIDEVNQLQAQLRDVARDVGDTGGLSQFGLTEGQASGVVNSTVNLQAGAIVINADGATAADKDRIRELAEQAARAVWDEAAREAAAAGRR